MKRSGKFYSRNEKQTLQSLGLKPQPMSGAGWLHKEDGINDVALVQLKSTDAQSYRLNMLDMKKLEYNAMVEHKVPIFLVQFLKQEKVYAIVDVDNLAELSRALETGQPPEARPEPPPLEQIDTPKVKADPNARKKYEEERKKEYASRKWKR